MERCDNCGHVFGARCSECGREMLCGSFAVSCPVKECAERVLSDRAADLRAGPVEAPRRG